MEPAVTIAEEHFFFRLQQLNCGVEAALWRQRASNRVLAASNTRGVYLSEAQAEALMARVQMVAERLHAEIAPAMTDEAASMEDAIRNRAVAGGGLPFDRLAALGLTRDEQDAILVCAAPEIDRGYERLFGYILDDLTRRTPSVALLLELLSTDPVKRARLLPVFGPFGALRRRRLLLPVSPADSEARQELRLSPGVLDFLLTGIGTPGHIFNDPAEVDPLLPHTPAGIDRARLEKVAGAIESGTVGMVGVWSHDADGQAEMVHALCAAAGARLRRLIVGAVPVQSPREDVRAALLACETLRAVLWVEADRLTGEIGQAALDALKDHLPRATTPVIVSGRVPWRPTCVLASRAYCELEAGQAEYAARIAMWRDALPDVDDESRCDLAARFRLTSNELRAATHMAGMSALLAGNGHPAPVSEHLEDACTTVTQRNTIAFARLIKSRRRAKDLVLPGTLFEQVIEIPRFLRAWPRVADQWGFTRMDGNAGAVKALFTGDSGTGKTLAAEVIAGELAAPLIKVDLARVVSKWIGETEKNLAAVFDEARNMHAVLFFDEADALFGRRGEVVRGTDRYANLEVSYLLQRLEEHDAGIVILASNLRDNIDAAFTRRFQVTLHFPRPNEELRRRLWRAAIPTLAPLDGVNFDVLAHVDLTGGGISGAARTAALLAADAGSAAIGMEHLVQGIARQFKREARLLTPAELGPFADLARGT